MIPNTLSATSLQVAEGCLSRFKAEVIDRGANYQGDAAGVGIVLHGTLENFVRGVFMRKDTEWDWTEFYGLFCREYEAQFGPDRNKDEWYDALSIAKKWFHNPEQQNNLSATKILSLESKHFFMLPVVINGIKHEIRVNYIMDRLEQTGPNEYKVVDYKTNRIPLSAQQIREKIQARLYALAVQIVHPTAEIVWVEFDFLRHDTVAVAFTKAENADTWRMLKRAAQRIIDTSDAKAEKLETLNEECIFCVKKATCKALTSNIKVGGINSLGDNDAIRRYAEIKQAAKALDALKGELEMHLLQILIAAQQTTMDLEDGTIQFKRSSKRTVDSSAALSIIGPTLAMDRAKINISELDELIASGALSQQQIEALNSIIKKEFGKPSIEVKLKKAI